MGDGLVTFRQGQDQHWLTVFGGFADVGPDHVTILARVSETVEMIDVERAEAARQRSLQLLKEAQTEVDLDFAQAKLRASPHPPGGRRPAGRPRVPGRVTRIRTLDAGEWYK